MAYISTTVAPSYGTVNPNNGGYFFNVLQNKWYDPSGVVVDKGLNFLDAIVYADTTGNATYIESIGKIEYKDIVKANKFVSKNSCTAWVNFDGTTTPPTIRDSFNVSKVIRTDTGEYDVYFENEMDNLNYSISSMSADGSAGTVCFINENKETPKINKVSIRTTGNLNTSNFNTRFINIQIFGGKN